MVALISSLIVSPSSACFEDNPETVPKFIDLDVQCLICKLTVTYSDWIFQLKKPPQTNSL